ncbi:MAG: bacillithiol biosynthesis cysteine-adding enzyme BshC [Cyclobacteriaceae bacterium]|nr:bacillithiol biosynthesis cysteine-adding enzyme BshC [Cyclobacteriaceae bacterium]
MISGRVSFELTRVFTPLFLDYINGLDILKPFYNRFPSKELFSAQLAEKSSGYPVKTRQVLVQVLQRQYSQLEVAGAVQDNLMALREEKTFTVTTGHQLNIFTGPLYFIYKIITVINTCKELKRLHPDYRFVPVFWMASEDHDVEEIRSVRIHGKIYSWETNQKGAVGRFSTQGLAELAGQIPADVKVFHKAYAGFGRLSDAVRCYVNDLFGKYGLIVADGDDAELKKLFVPVMQDDIFSNTAYRRVMETDEILKDRGYKPQVYVRPVNLFYLGDDVRSRIERLGDNYRVTDTELIFTPDELNSLLHEHPEKLSPNVILRPLYQECVLPNLAYVGGPAEVAYWLQLKSLFGHYQIPFPIIMPRNFALLVKQSLYRKLQKTGLSFEELFIPLQELLNEVALRHAPDHIRLNGQKAAILNQLEAVRENAKLIDPTLSTMVAAETKRMLKTLEKIELKMLRAEKRKQADRLRQVTELKEALFPNGGLQERIENFLSFTSGNPELIDALIGAFEPFDYRFNICLVND